MSAQRTWAEIGINTGQKRRICTGKWKLYGNNPEELYGIRGISGCEETEKKLSFESPGRTKTVRWNT